MIGTRFLDRVKLMRQWVLVTMLPDYGKCALAAMALIVLGNLTEAACFVSAAHLLSRAAVDASPATLLPQGYLIIGGALLTVLVAGGAFAAYRGQSLAARTAVAYENATFAHGIGIARRQNGTARDLSADERDDVTMRAPRYMARGMLQIISLATSIVLAMIGLLVCAYVYPELTLILVLMLVLASPLYIMASIHSTTVGHRMHRSAKAFSEAKRKLATTWLSAKEFDPSLVQSEALEVEGYTAFLDAYGDRLILSPQSRLLGSMAFSICILVAFLWIGLRYEPTVAVISQIVAYVVFLRMFFSGLIGIFSGIQAMNTFVPYFLRFLTLDPRLQGARGSPTQ